MALFTGSNTISLTASASRWGAGGLTPVTITNLIDCDALSTGGLTRRTSHIVHGSQAAFTMVPGLPVKFNFIYGVGGRSVPWGILQEVVEVDEAEVRTWTASAGPLAGQTVGVSLENGRCAMTISALYAAGQGLPKKADILSFPRGDGTLARLIVIRITRRWSNQGWQEVQIDGTQWDGALSRIF